MSEEHGKCERCGRPWDLYRGADQLFYRTACICPPNPDYVKAVQAYEAGETDVYPHSKDFPR